MKLITALKRAFLAILLLSSFTASAQTVITMEKVGGVYYIPCKVNGVDMKFIFDTGASTIFISRSTAQSLMDKGLLSENDYVGTAKSRIADGSVVENKIYKLKSIEIKGLKMINVEAMVSTSLNAPLLLGLSAIQRLGKVTIDGNTLIIHKSSEWDSPENINKLNKALELFGNHSYQAALAIFEQMYSEYGFLSEYCMQKMIACMCSCGEYAKTIEYGKQWMSLYGDEDEEMEIIASETGETIAYMKNLIDLVCLDVGDAYRLTSHYNEAIEWYQQRISPNCFSHYIQGMLHEAIGRSYWGLKQYYNARFYFKNAVSYLLSNEDATTDDLRGGRVQDEEIGRILNLYANSCYQLGNEPEADEAMILSAKCGDKEAIDFCIKCSLPYTTSLNFDLE